MRRAAATPASVPRFVQQYLEQPSNQHPDIHPPPVTTNKAHDMINQLAYSIQSERLSNLVIKKNRTWNEDRKP